MNLKKIQSAGNRKTVWFLFSGFLMFLISLSQAATRIVGSGETYTNIRSAITGATPGDTILINGGVYSGDQYIEGLKGTEDSMIVIRAATGSTVTVNGGSEGWHFSDPAHIRIENITFTGQSGNSVNVDDGGDYTTPAHDVVFDKCTWKDMNASGNNDQLKLSGLDNFEIRNCVFSNGSGNGSGIDMVGCHHGVIIGNKFENQGSNSIQAKGGTQFLRIERNLFRDGGERTLNLGGSTGLQFFRPLDAAFEAADIKVCSNVFIRSYAPIAFVGCVRVHVVNNTIFKPEHWVIRILQETVDQSRFYPCGDNVFRNNIIYQGTISTECNVGSNTAPGTFAFSNNLWFNYQSSSFTPRNIPVKDSNNIVGFDPLFKDTSLGDFSISVSSPAKGKGFDLDDPVYDFLGNRFALSGRSIGASEAVSVRVNREGKLFSVLPVANGNKNTRKMYTLNGRVVSEGTFNTNCITGNGVYFLKEGTGYYYTELVFKRK